MILLQRLAWQRVWLFAAPGAIALVGLCAWPYTVDDAFIVGRYAARLAGGLGYTFNPGPATDGVTGPAWLLPGLLAACVGADPIVAAKACGLLCSALCAWIALAALRRRAQGTALIAVAGVLLASEPGLGGSGVAGLETGAAALLLTLAATAALQRPAPSTDVAGIAVGALAWLRPELAGAACVLLCAISARSSWAKARRAWIWAAGGALSVCAFRLQISGRALPLSLYAKAGSIADGAAYSARAVLIGSGGLGLILVGAGAWFGRSRARWLAGVLAAHACCVTLAGGDWMPGFRLYVPVIPIYAQLAAEGAVTLWRRGRAARALAALSLLGACAVSLLDLATRIPEWRAAAHSRETVARPLAAKLRACAQRVALVDIGFIGYASGREIVDLGGITDPAVALLPGGHLNKHIDSDWLARRAPDTIILHSITPPSAADDGSLGRLGGYPVEQRLASSAWVRRDFQLVESQRYAPNYYYAVLRRRGAAWPAGAPSPGFASGATRLLPGSD
jgi:hypothetical protein